MRGFETFTRDTQDLIIMYIEELAKKEDNMERQREYLYGLREFKIMEMFYGVCGMDKSQIEIEDVIIYIYIYINIIDKKIIKR